MTHTTPPASPNLNNYSSGDPRLALARSRESVQARGIPAAGSPAPRSLLAPHEAIQRAAALLDAVARDAEDAVDMTVPIRCGFAADLLNRVAASAAAKDLTGGTVNGAELRGQPLVLSLADDAHALGIAVHEAIDLLQQLPAAVFTRPVFEALRAALRASDALRAPGVS